MIYAGIAHAGAVFAEHTEHTGNYAEFMVKLALEIPMNSKKVFTHAEY